MPSPLHCKNCNCPIDIAEAIASSPFSWPNMSTFWHECPECDTGNHVRVSKDQVSIIEILGAPGPTWETIQTARLSELVVVVDPSYLQVWLGDIHRAIPARK